MTARRIHRAYFRSVFLLCATLILLGLPASAQDRDFQVDPAQSSVKFTLGDVLHTVHGTFKVKHGDLQMDSSGKMSGDIIVDAKSGESGSGMRDRKMHKEVLETERYPEIAFRPAQIEGPLPGSGKASVRIHGTFSIHGVDREITVPAQVDIEADHWTAAVHFTVPYQKWGMKNPSTLFLKVSDSVDIDLVATGTTGSRTATSAQ